MFYVGKFFISIFFKKYWLFSKINTREEKYTWIFIFTSSYLFQKNLKISFRHFSNLPSFWEAYTRTFQTFYNVGLSISKWVCPSQCGSVHLKEGLSSVWWIFFAHSRVFSNKNSKFYVLGPKFYVSKPQILGLLVSFCPKFR